MYQAMVSIWYSIIGIGQRRDYHVKLPSGRIYWRNRRFLRPRVLPAPSPAAASTPVTVVAPHQAPQVVVQPATPPATPASAQQHSHRPRKQNVQPEKVRRPGVSHILSSIPH